MTFICGEMRACVRVCVCVCVCVIWMMQYERNNGRYDQHLSGINRTMHRKNL